MQVTGRVKITSKISTANYRDIIAADFTVKSDAGYSFQVRCHTYAIKGHQEGDKIEISGQLRDEDGDAYIWAGEISL